MHWERISQDILNLKELPVPLYSAVKIEGKRAYRYAPQGLFPELPVRPVQIFSFSLHSIEAPFVTYSCTVSKGTYIRSLSEHIAGLLGTVAHTTELCRTAIGGIGLGQAHTLAELPPEDIQSCYIPPERLLGGYESRHPDEQQLSLLRQGQRIPDPGPDADDIMIYSPSQQLAGVARRRGNELIPVVNLH